MASSSSPLNFLYAELQFWLRVFFSRIKLSVSHNMLQTAHIHMICSAKEMWHFSWIFVIVCISIYTIHVVNSVWCICKKKKRCKMSRWITNNAFIELHCIFNCFCVYVCLDGFCVRRRTHLYDFYLVGSVFIRFRLDYRTQSTGQFSRFAHMLRLAHIHIVQYNSHVNHC